MSARTPPPRRPRRSRRRRSRWSSTPARTPAPPDILDAGVCGEQHRRQLARLLLSAQRQSGQVIHRHRYARQYVPAGGAVQRDRGRSDDRDLLRREHRRRSEHGNGPELAVGWRCGLRSWNIPAWRSPTRSTRRGGTGVEHSAEQRLADDNHRRGSGPRDDRSRRMRRPSPPGSGFTIQERVTTSSTTLAVEDRRAGDRRIGSRPRRRSPKPSVGCCRRDVPRGRRRTAATAGPDDRQDAHRDVHARARRGDLHADGDQQRRQCRPTGTVTVTDTLPSELTANGDRGHELELHAARRAVHAQRRAGGRRQLSRQSR